MNNSTSTLKQTFNHNSTAYLFILLLSLLQLALVHAYVPIGAWFSSDAIYTDDFSFHYGHVLEKISYLKEFGKLWGYNPFIRAGSIVNAVATIDNNGCVLFSFLLFFIPVEISFKLYFILGIGMVPVLCYKAARNFELSQEVSLLSSLLATLLMHVSVMVNFIYWGTVSFVFSSYISILTVSFFYRFCLRNTIKDLICATLLLIVAVWIHAFSVVILFVPLLLCYLLSLRRMSWLFHLSILVSLLLTVVANMPWLYPFLTFQDHIVKEPSSFFYATNSLLEPLKTYLFRDNLFNSFFNMVFHKEEWVDILLLLSALCGIYLWNKNGKRLKTVLFLGSFSFFFFLSYYGSFFEITSITPMRFLISLNIFLVFPSAVGLNYLYRFFLSDKSFKVKVVSSAVLGYLLIALLATPYYHLFYKKDFRLVYKVPEPFSKLVVWIKNNTTKKGRILIENSDFESEHQYYGTHLPFLLPEWTDREYIGNFTYYSITKDSFTTYNNALLLRKPVGGYSLEELWSYLELYNIKWIIYWSEESKKVFESGYNGYTPLTCIDKFHICEVERNPTFFIKGKGLAIAKLNEIYLEEIESVDDEIIISYHWMKYLKTNPPRRLESVSLLEDPIGFIKIKNPPPSISIYNSYQPVK